MLAQATALPTNDPTMWIWIAVAAVVILVLIALASRRRKSDSRKKRGSEPDIRPVTSDARARYTETWRNIQARFVDDPSAALADADRLLSDVMRDRLGNAAVTRDGRGEANTEDLRRRMVAYRALFADLVGADPNGNRTEGRSVA